MALTQVKAAGLTADLIDETKLADNSIDSEHYNDGSIDNAHLAANSVDSDNYVDGSIDNAHLANNAVDTDEIADNAVTLAKMASGTDGQIITYDASGNPTAVGPGTDGQVLTSTGANSSPAFEDAAGGGILLQVKDTFESDEVLVSTEGTWTDLDTSVTITPTDATTKMIIWARVGGIWTKASTNWIGVRLIGTATGMTEYNRMLEYHYGYYTSDGANSPVGGWMGPVSTAVVHDHNETDAITYKLQAIVYDHSDDEATFMLWGNDDNRCNATIIVQEFST